MIYSKESARVEIARLVEEFRLHEKALDRAPEAQIENDFIRPLFQCLNWNVRNTGLSPAQHEFRLQRTDRRGKRPDYILSLEGRDVLVMDAKQVKYSMRDPRWLYQVYSYAYSTQSNSPAKKIDFAVLTDFQEFIVLDCTLFAARPEAVDNFRVIDWRYPDYVEQFDTLWDLFERSLVLKNSGSQGGLWSRYLSPQKVKANRIAPDKAFLAQMDDERTGWRVLLAKDMKKRNPAATGDLITAAVQLLIDRLIFVKALSDREIDDDYLGKLAATVEKSGDDDEAGWFNACRHIFKDLNRFYNGSIFAARPELEAVSVSNKVVRAVIRDLQPENSPYNFSVLPVEILGTIYERFLGRVVRTTDKQVKIEEKPEVRKAGGVFYTPQYIVENIVKNTVGKLLRECKTPADVAKLKILDPACGSGSFLLGAYSALIQWHKDYFVAQASGLRNGKSRQNYYLGETGEIRLTAKLKRDILRNNLFGVDIDPQAVEVTRFSLSLKALEDLREGELTEESDLFNETVLPDLSGNIKNGNSLIGMDYFDGQMFVDTATMKRVNAFDWETEFPEIMKAGGFDAIIGNPPYGALFSERDKTYFRNYYKTTQGRFESFQFFIESGMSAIREGGYLSFIVPDTWFTLRDTENLRRLLLTESFIEQLVVLHENVFEKVKVDVCVFVSSKSKKMNLTKVKIASKDHTAEDFIAGKFVNEFEIDQRSWLANNECRIVVNLSNKGEQIISKLKKVSVLLEEIALATTGPKPYQVGKGNPPQTKQILETKPFTTSYKKDETFRIMLRGSDISRYSFPNKKDEWLSYGEWLAEVRGPSVFKKERLLIQSIRNPKLERRIIATYVKDESVNNNSITNIVMLQSSIYSILYLLGILNSNLINWFFAKSYNIVNIDPRYLKRVFIRSINFSDPAEKAQHDRMVALVTNMLELHKARAAAKTQSEQELYNRQIAATDQQIDRLVYDLYGLTEEEINIVEAG